MKTLCIYHSADLDGWMSAAIVKKWFLEKVILVQAAEQGKDYIRNANHSIDFLGWNYGDEIPDLLEYNKVIMCDISFSKEIMTNLFNRLDTKLIWIDHHESAILDILGGLTDGKDTSSLFKGLRDTNFAACELTWKYFFPEEAMPELVRLLGRYDCWGHKGTYEEQYVLEFQYGARQQLLNYEHCYEALTTRNLKELVPFIHQKGIVIYNYLNTEAKLAYKKAFSVVLPYSDPNIEYITEAKFLSLNKSNFNASAFNLPYTKDGYDGFMTFSYNAEKHVWEVSLRSETINVSLIAKQYGGGGHRGAAGFSIPFDGLSKLLNK